MTRFENLAIDPGKNGLGWAIVGRAPPTEAREQLISAGFFEGRGGAKSTLLQIVDQFDRHVAEFSGSLRSAIIERPAPYEAAHQKGGQAGQYDLHDLSLVVGALGYMLQRHGVDVRFVFPREWKGQMPKEVTRARVEEALSPEERARVQWPAKSKCHNVFDAIHLALRTFTQRKV